MTGFKARLDAVQEEISRAAAATGRNLSEVRLLPVSKMHPVSALQEALDCGVREFGENRPQDIAAKAEILGANFASLEEEGAPASLAEDPSKIGGNSPSSAISPRWIMIGNLQRNKAKLIVAHAAELQSLDSLPVAQTLSRLLTEAGRELEVMVQVNTSQEAAKHGVTPEAALDFAGEVASLPGLRLRGFMTVAAPLATVGEAEVRREFALLREIRDTAVSGDFPGATELSMGMSGDFKVAIAEGSTCVRVGSALFGARDYGGDPRA